MFFEILGSISDIQIIARGSGIRAYNQLNKKHGKGAWRKLKGIATVKLENGNTRLAEVHWYEAHGIGKKDLKIKHFLD